MLKRLATLVILSGFYSLAGCQTAPKINPNVKVKIYQGDPIHRSIHRRANNHEIQCKDPRFSQYLCVSYKDFEKLLNACEYWK